MYSRKRYEPVRKGRMNHSQRADKRHREGVASLMLLKDEAKTRKLTGRSRR